MPTSRNTPANLPFNQFPERLHPRVVNSPLSLSCLERRDALVLLSISDTCKSLSVASESAAATSGQR